MSQKFGWKFEWAMPLKRHPERGEGGGEDGQAMNVLIGVNQPLVRGHSLEAATDEVHC